MTDWVTYRSEEGGFALEHPVSWQATEGVLGSAVVVTAPEGGTGGFTPNVSVATQELSAPLGLDEFSDAQFATMGELLTDVRLLDRSDASLLNRPGRRVLVTFRQGVHALALEQWWTVADAGPGAVVVSGTCAALDYDAYADVFAHMAATLCPDEGA